MLRDLERCASALKVCEDLDNPEIFRVAAALRAYGLDGRKVFIDWLKGMGRRLIGGIAAITIRLITLRDCLISVQYVEFAGMGKKSRLGPSTTMQPLVAG